jgi:Bacterial protein of unknown function (DUF899)
LRLVVAGLGYGVNCVGCGGGVFMKKVLLGKEEEKIMTEHSTGTREEWLAARRELLEAEKELTRRSDELARQRQQIPWARIEKD